MKYRGPVITLFAVAALAAVLFVVNMRTVAATVARSSVPPAEGQPPVVTQPPEATEPPKVTEPPTDEPPAGEPAPPPPAVTEQVTYAGRTSGNEATIAIAVQGGEVSAYVCDGKQTEAWLEGTIEDGRLTLQGADGATATGAVQDGAIFGTVWVQGTQWPYSAQRAEAPAGLYQGEGTVDGAAARAGWIVLQDGSQVGVANIDGVRRPSPAIDPNQLSGVQVGGSVLVPEPVGGAENVVEPPS